MTHPYRHFVALGDSFTECDEVTWVRTSAAPWANRRVTGRSSGDGLDPRHPTYTHLG